MAQAQNWQNRIVGHDTVDPSELVANPKNWRIHPKHQQDALDDVLDDVGWVQTVIVNRQSGYVLDGHLRVTRALARNEKSIPVTYVELDDVEESLVLMTFDPLAAMAAADREQLESLMHDIDTDSEALSQMLSELAEKEQVIDFDTPDPDPQEDPVLDADVVIQLTCSHDAFARIESTLQQWQHDHGITVDVSA